MDINDFDALDGHRFDEFLQNLDAPYNGLNGVPNLDSLTDIEELQKLIFSTDPILNDLPDLTVNNMHHLQQQVKEESEPQTYLDHSLPTQWQSASNTTNVFPPSPPYEPEEVQHIQMPQNFGEKSITIQSADTNQIADVKRLATYIENHPQAPLLVIPIPNKQSDNPQLLCQMLGGKDFKNHNVKSVQQALLIDNDDSIAMNTELKRKLQSTTPLQPINSSKKIKLPTNKGADSNSITMAQSIAPVMKPNKIQISPLRATSPQNGRPKKEKKVSGHNEVERRYREKMNTQFDNLRSLVFGHGAKSAKTQTLSKAIQEIKVLRKYSRALQLQNTQLRTLVPTESENRLPPATRSLSSFTKAWNRRNGCGSGSSDDNTDKDSDDDIDPLLSSSSSVSSPESTVPISPNSALVGDKSRAGLCLFMFLFMVYMPFNGGWSMQQGLKETYHGSSRRLFNIDFETSSTGYAIVFYAVQIIFSFLMFMWLFIKSEPTLGKSAKKEIQFWDCMNKAEYHSSKNNMELAFEHLESALRLLNKPLPLTILDRLCCIWWNLLCHMLNQFGISHFIHWLCKGIKWQIKSDEEIAKRQLASRMATIAYQKLHELLLTDPKRKNENLLACVASINAINCADALSFSVGPELTCRAYLNACLHLKARFPILQRWLSSYYHGCAHNIFRLHYKEISSSLAWAFHYDATNFILYGDWDLSCSPSPASDPADVGNCLGVVTQQYHTSMLQSVLKAIVTPEASLPSLSKRQCLMEAENMLSTIRRSELYRDSSDGLSNDSTAWWFDVIARVLYIEHGFEDEKSAMPPLTEEMPQFKNPSWNRLVEGIHESLSVHHELAKDGDDSDLDTLECRLDVANKCLAECCVTLDVDDHDYTELLQLMTLFSADVILKARYRLWEKSGKQASNEQLTKFNECIGILQRYSATYPELKHKVRYYSTIVRIAVGTNPMLTAQLLKRKNCRASLSLSPTTEETEMAKTYVAAYKHLPQSSVPRTSVTSIVTTLKNAGKILEKSNENYIFKECKLLLLQYSNLSCAHM